MDGSGETGMMMCETLDTQHGHPYVFAHSHPQHHDQQQHPTHITQQSQMCDPFMGRSNTHHENHTSVFSYVICFSFIHCPSSSPTHPTSPIHSV